MQKQFIDNLILTLGNIKNLRRRGWIKRHVSDPESDADHMYSVALEVLLLAPEHLDRFHCLELALTHDLPELYASDFTPGEIAAAEKYELELAAARRLAAELNFPQLVEWFAEFEAQKTPEAAFVKCLDKLDNVLTAAYYERSRRSSEGLLREFSAHAAAGISASACADKDVCSEIINTVINNAKQP